MKRANRNMNPIKPIILFASLVLSTNVFCQGIIASESVEPTQESCKELFAGLEIFKVVETPPLIKSIDYEALEESIQNIVKQLRLNKGHKSILTLKIFFPIEGRPCIHSIEIDGDILRDKKAQQLISPFENITEYESGKQRNKSVICEAIFDIIIRKGKLRDLQYSNVRFE